MHLVDAHQHFWDISRPDCHWPTAKLPAIYRTYLPETLAPLLQVHQVSGTVLVQSQPTGTDTAYLLAIAEQHDFVKAVVGWVDLESASAPDCVRELSQHPKLRGLRPMVQNIADDAWLLNPALAPALRIMQQHRLSLDALVLPRHLPYLYRFAQRYPKLDIVIDHGAKPAITGQAEDLQNWREALAPLAELRQCYCKLSGLLTEATTEVDEALLYPYVRTLIELFGPQRVLWGSDWPVVNLNGSYANWLSLSLRLVKQALLDSGSSDARIATDMQAVFAGNAQRFYRFPSTSNTAENYGETNGSGSN